jgi:hypothetical protein
MNDIPYSTPSRSLRGPGGIAGNVTPVSPCLSFRERSIYAARLTCSHTRDIRAWPPSASKDDLVAFRVSNMIYDFAIS